MHRRQLLLAILALVLILTGCKGKASEQVADAQGQAGKAAAVDPGVQFTLQYLPGRTTDTRPQPQFTIQLENCAAPQALTREHHERWNAPQSYMLGPTSIEIDLAPYAAVIASIVRSAYQIDTGPTRSIEGIVSLVAMPNTRAEYDLRWEERWEDNVLLISRNNQQVGAAPIQVLVTARLHTVAIRQQECPQGLLAPVTGPAGVKPPPQLQVTPQPAVPDSGEGMYPQSGSDESIALVRSYLSAIASGNTREAYNLLQDAYRARWPYDVFSAGYQGIRDIEVHYIESVLEAKGLERVRAGITITQTSAEQTVMADWWIAFEVVSAAKPPYQRAIRAVAMQRIPPE
jgi:hypothetical protein